MSAVLRMAPLLCVLVPVGGGRQLVVLELTGESDWGGCGDWYRATALGDLDGDARADIVLFHGPPQNPGNPLVEVWLSMRPGIGDGTFGDEIHLVSGYTYEGDNCGQGYNVFVVDIDRDWDNDVVVTVGGGPGRILTWTNQTSTPFNIADLDKDGDVDLDDFAIFAANYTGAR